MSNTLVPGKYQARAIDYGITVSEKGDPWVTVLFDIFPDGQNLNWRGNLVSDKGREITIKALKTLGCIGGIKELARGKESGCLDLEKTVELDLAHEEYNGRTFLKIQWVNEVGGGGFRNRLTEVEAVHACAGLNLDAQFLASGIKIQSAPPVRSNPVAAPTHYENIPF